MIMSSSEYIFYITGWIFAVLLMLFIFFRYHKVYDFMNHPGYIFFFILFVVDGILTTVTFFLVDNLMYY